MAQYTAGTVSVTGGSATVTGAGTQWLTSADPIQAGDMFWVRGDQTSYTVAAVDGDTQLQLSAPYAGTTATGVFYVLARDFTPSQSYPYPRPGDVDAVMLVSRAIQMIDADIGGSPGNGNGGGGNVNTLDDLNDVDTTGALSGWVLRTLEDGSFGFSTIPLNITNLGEDGAALSTGRSGNTVSFRRLKTVGATVTENPNDITITVPAPGETNTLAHLGTAESQSLVGAKTGSALGLLGLRPGANVAITPEGNDLVISAVPINQDGESQIIGAQNIGGGTGIYSSTDTGVLRFKSFSFSDRFAVDASGEAISVTFNTLPFTDVGGVDVSGATAGQVLVKGEDGTWRGQALPEAGITRVSDDEAPSLGGELSTAGHDIVGLTGMLPGLIEKPKVKRYRLTPYAVHGLDLTAITVVCASGSVTFAVYVDNTAVSGLTGTATTTRQTIAGTGFVNIASDIELVVTAIGAGTADFSFALHAQRA